MSRLGQYLKDQRGELSLYEVGKATGIARIDLSRYEKGELLPTSEKLKKLSGFYEISYKTLRILYYEDFFSDKEEREIVLEWAKMHL